MSDVWEKQNGEMIACEVGPIRPPSESESLLLRFTRNCPWNQCRFCNTYQGKKFSLRRRDEIEKEIEFIAEVVSTIRRLSFALGKDGQIDEELIRWIAQQADTTETMIRVAVWMFHGGKSVFIQDANSLLMKPEEVTYLIEKIRKSFPFLKRITTYARTQTLSRMSVEQLVGLKNAGLSRIHVGLESGNDAILKMMRKGATADHHLEGSRKTISAGIELSVYIILGLGGELFWREHAEGSATLLNNIRPDFIRFRTLAIPQSAPLYSDWISGAFKKASDNQIIREERLLIEKLEGFDSSILSDHVTNLLAEVEGHIPEEKEKILDIIDGFLKLDPKQQELFQIARRLGFCMKLDHLDIPAIQRKAEEIYGIYRKSEYNTIDEFLAPILARYM